MYEFHSYRDNLHYNKDTTYYYLWNSTDLSYGYQCVLVDYVLNTLNKPLICGETGANIGLSGKELQRELDYFANELTIFNQWGVNYTSFWWLGRETKYAELLDGPGYQPNQAGQIVINKIAG
jgi:hypothetical protein